MSDINQGFFSQEQLVSLPSFANDNFNDGTVTFTRVYRRHANLQCTKLLLTPLTVEGRHIREFPILFHVVGRLCHDECSMSTIQKPGSTEDSISIKLCIQELPEVISHAEWLQCAIALQSLEALAILETSKYIDTKELFCESSDPESGDLKLFIHGLQAMPRSPKQSRNSEPVTDASTSGKTTPKSLSNADNPEDAVRHESNPRNREVSVVPPRTSNPSLAAFSKETLPAIAASVAGNAEHLVFDVMDHHIMLTDLTQLPEDVPVRVTFSLMLVPSNMEHTLSLRAVLLKLTLL